MTFPNYLNSKRNFLIIWLCFHFFALFLNVFKIEGVIREVENCANCQTRSYLYLLTNQHEREGDESFSNFWPISGITTTYVYNSGYFKQKNIFYSPEDYETKYVNFNGIFNDYDISEFIAYNLILLVILYFKWDKRFKNSSKQ